MTSSFLVSLLFLSSAFSLEPNPPNWPSSVYVFDPSTPSVTQNAVDTAFATNGGHSPAFNGQFSPYRYAFLFKPGVHQVKVNVGYYTSVIGLGRTPQDTTIGDVICENGDFDYSGGALDNFWRSAENFHTVPSITWNNENAPAMLWAVSQAAPLRRVYVDGNLDLYEYNYGCCAGYASGGYLGDSVVTGQVTSGSQQQWVTRNSQVGVWSGGVWNMVFVGNTGAVPLTLCPPFTTVDSTPIIAEKPFLQIDPSTGKYNLLVPPVQWNKKGPTDYNNGGETAIPFENVFVARDTDDASVINAKIASGLHVVFTPGLYNLSGTITVNVANTILLGIGFPTFKCFNGQPCFRVGDVDGVRIAGVLVEPGDLSSPILLQWGSGAHQGNNFDSLIF
jgi:hypothetical protein